MSTETPNQVARRYNSIVPRIARISLVRTILSLVLTTILGYVDLFSELMDTSSSYSYYDDYYYDYDYDYDSGYYSGVDTLGTFGGTALVFMVLFLIVNVVFYIISLIRMYPLRKWLSHGNESGSASCAITGGWMLVASIVFFFLFFCIILREYDLGAILLIPYFLLLASLIVEWVGFGGLTRIERFPKRAHAGFGLLRSADVVLFIGLVITAFGFLDPDGEAFDVLSSLGLVPGMSVCAVLSLIGWILLCIPMPVEDGDDEPLPELDEPVSKEKSGKDLDSGLASAPTHAVAAPAPAPAPVAEPEPAPAEPAPAEPAPAEPAPAAEPKPAKPAPASKPRRFCTNCGAPLRDGDKFCATCGTPVAKQDA